MSGNINHEEAIFEQALKCSSPEARAAILDDACRGNPELRARLDLLLEGHFKAQGFLDRAADLRPVPVDEEIGATVGHYKVLEKIGEGGCGIVYVAEQEEPVRRRVALKVIKLGMDTKQVSARFDAERQALAMMDHPNIAKVFDAGATETGRPYFVMELVRGIKITDYCEQNQLASRERLDLFIQVCRAIQHAHQKGIIHRDIKPSNILVTLHDGVAVPKVIDFGIAKATQGRLTDQTVYTAFEQFIGTPAYMSPEQAEMSGLDVDTRSDIYSLGVLLYELLTGKTPFDAKELLAAGLDEMRRTIREVEPVKPSTRLRSNSELETRNAEQDRASSRRLLQEVRGDLDWIVMKCLEKDRARRYETANGLASDIRRHLNNEPVSARPPGGMYRFRKWARRNKVAFGTALVVAAAALLAIVVLIVSSLRIDAARRAEHIERGKSDAANRELRGTVSLLELQHAEDFFRAGDAGLGTAHLAAMLRRDPSNHIAASRLMSALVHRNWAVRNAPAMRHAGMVESVCFSPDGRQVLSASLDRTARIWDAATGKLIATLQHEDRISCAHYNPDGSLIVTASADGTARIWNSTNGTPMAPPLRHEGKVNWAEFSPDGQSVVTASSDRTARIWETATGTLKRTLSGHTTPVLLARFSNDGERVATSDEWGSTRIWNTESGELLFQLEERRSRIVALAFSADGHRLVTACEDQVARLWNPATGEALGEPMVHHGKIHHVAFNPSGGTLVTSSQDGTVRFWDTTNGVRVGNVLAHEGGVLFAEFSSDGKRIVMTSQDNSARVWDVPTGAPLCQPLRHIEAVNQARFSPDGLRLVTGGQDWTVQIWELRSDRDEGREARFGKLVKSVAFSTDGKLLVAASLDGTARVLDAVNGQPCSDPLRQEAAMQSVAFSPDAQWVVTGSTNGQAFIWNWRSAQVVAGPLQHSNRIRSVQFSPDGERALTASEDGTARVWNARNGLPLTPPLKHGGVVIVAQFSHDGRLVATASKDKSARVWDAQTGEPRTSPLWHGDEVGWVEFSRDDKKLATASDDNTARIWDVQTGQAIIPPLAHTRTVSRARFSFDGRFVATAALDQTARIWDAATGQALTGPLKHNSPGILVCFAPDGQRIATGCWNGEVRLWDTRTGQPLTDWLNALGGVDDICFDPTGQRLATASWVARVWDVPPVPIPVPDWLPGFAEAVAGVRLGPRGALEIVSQPEFEAAVRQLRRKDAGQLDERLARLFLAPPTRQEPGARLAQAVEEETSPSKGKAAAATNSLPARSIAVRPANTPPNLIDLSTYYNAAFEEDWHNRNDPTNKENNLATLPRGRQSFDGIEFDVRGIVQLSSRILKRLDESFPPTVEGIKIQSQCQQIHFVQATAWQVGNGTNIGSYIVHYVDGRREDVPLIYGEDLWEWWSGNALARDAGRASLAWTGKNPRGDNIQLYHRFWRNPQPDVEIESIDFVSAMTDAAPFLIAITVE